MDKLLFITHCTDKYTYLQSVEVALKGGCKDIQLRMKDSPVEEVEETAIQAKELCDVYGARLYIDDHVQVCLNVKCTGVHLGKLDMSPSEARKILGSNFMIGGTANTFGDIQQLVSQGVDYIGLGPFRFTTTKKNLSPVLGLPGYQEIISECKENNILIPVYAIGGITFKDIPVLMETGISGIALSSTILKADDPVAEIKRILSII